MAHLQPFIFIRAHKKQSSWSTSLAEDTVRAAAYQTYWRVAIKEAKLCLDPASISMTQWKEKDTFQQILPRTYLPSGLRSLSTIATVLFIRDPLRQPTSSKMLNSTSVELTTPALISNGSITPISSIMQIVLCWQAHRLEELPPSFGKTWLGLCWSTPEISHL